MQVYQRTPCPNRIFEDTGAAFSIGAIGGVIFQCAQAIFTRYRIGAKLRYRVPYTAGSFALWGLSFSSCECGLQFFGLKNQPVSAVLSGGITGAVLAIQRGRKSIMIASFFGFILLTLIELAVLFAERLSTAQPPQDYRQ